MSKVFYDKKIFAKNLVRLMKEHQEKQTDIAALLKVSKSTVSDYCKGEQMPRMDKIEMLALHYGVLKSDLLEDRQALPENIIPVPRMNQIPLIGTIACGEPILADENIEEHVDIPEHIHADFALRCKGDSMIGARIHDGDIVYIRQQPSVDNGQIAAVLIEDEATLKRVYVTLESVVLQPENPSFPPLVYTGESMSEVRILGKLVGFTSTDIK